MICRSSSSNRWSVRMIEPSYSSVIFMMSTNLHPSHHSMTMSTNACEHLFTYSSTSMGSRESRTTSAMCRARAFSWSYGCRIARVLICADVSPLLLPSLPPALFCASTMRHESSAASCAGSSSLKTPEYMSSVASSSSQVLTSHATRPLFWMTPSSEMWPSRRRTRRMPLSSACIRTSWHALILARTSFSASMSDSRSRSRGRPCSTSGSHSRSSLSRDCTASILRCSAGTSASPTCISSTALRTGMDSGYRRWISLKTLSTPNRASRSCRSGGILILIEEIASRCANGTVTTCISASSRPRAGGGGSPLCTASSAPGAHGSSTSTLYSLVPPTVELRLWPCFWSRREGSLVRRKFTITPHP
mmetsp:Transcript_28891/g.72027  ORF Transcript_28891/g.72027 Transcript_28891/m.72027 type:complete len:362 (-) Transcript_28891:1833-2918(-)